MIFFNTISQFLLGSYSSVGSRCLFVSTCRTLRPSISPSKKLWPPRTPRSPPRPRQRKLHPHLQHPLSPRRARCPRSSPVRFFSRNCAIDDSDCTCRRFAWHLTLNAFALRLRRRLLCSDVELSYAKTRQSHVRYHGSADWVSAAGRLGAPEAVLSDDGRVLQGAFSCVFVVELSQLSAVLLL